MSARLAVWMLAVLAIARPAAAEAPLPARFVVIVANNKSLDRGTPDLEYADDDGALYYKLLSPFVAKIHLLSILDDDTQRRHPTIAPLTRRPDIATLRGTLGQLNGEIDALRRSGRPTELFFVFVGHGGLDDEGRGYLHLADGRLTRAEFFRDVVAASRAETTHIVIDACQAYSFIAGRGPGGQEANATFDRFLAGSDLDRYPSVGVFTAASDSPQTHEWSRIRAGVFSYQVRSGLAGAADVNHDGRIEYSELAAFVDAANARVPDFGKRVGVFVWPPRQNRHAPLLDVRKGEGVRHVVLDRPLTGRFALESLSGGRWFEFHKLVGDRLVLVLPRAQTFFLRGADGEVELADDANVRWVIASPTEATALRSRGAIDRAFDDALFSIPFGDGFYRGFVSGRQELVPVEDRSERFLVDASPPASRSAWRFEVAYQLAPFLLADGYLEHAVVAQVGIPVRPGFFITGSLGAGHVVIGAPLPATGFTRVAVAPGVMYRLVANDTFAATMGAELGYALVAIHGSSSTVDPSVGYARANVGGELRLIRPFWLRATAGWSAYLMTLDDGEAIRHRPEVSLGVLWHD